MIMFFIAYLVYSAYMFLSTTILLLYGLYKKDKELNDIIESMKKDNLDPTFVFILAITVVTTLWPVVLVLSFYALVKKLFNRIKKAG